MTSNKLILLVASNALSTCNAMKQIGDVYIPTCTKIHTGPSVRELKIKRKIVRANNSDYEKIRFTLKISDIQALFMVCATHITQFCHSKK